MGENTKYISFEILRYFLLPSPSQVGGEYEWKSEAYIMALTIAQTKYEHVVIDEKSVPIIAGTNMKVIELVLEKSAYGWSPEELHFQHPYLTLGQIYSALAYYWDHKDALDRDMEERLKLVNQIQKETRRTPLEKRLKSKGLT